MRYVLELYTSSNPDLVETVELETVDSETVRMATVDALWECEARDDLREIDVSSSEEREDLTDGDVPGERVFIYAGWPVDDGDGEGEREGELYMVRVHPAESEV